MKQPPNDTDTSMASLKETVRAFCAAREWDPFHTPKDLAIGLVTEASELLEIFRFQTPEQCEDLVKEKGREAVADELADSLFFLLRFAGRFDFDLTEALLRKLEKNALRYPVQTFKGNNQKSTL